MPIYYERDDGRRLVVATSIGSVTLSDALAIIDRQAAEGAWSFGVLYDVRASDYLPTSSDVHAMVKHVGTLTIRHGPRGPVALVVANPALDKISRRYASLGELTGLDVRVFTATDEAEQWLDSSRP